MADDLRARAGLALYAAAVLTATLVHDPRLLGAGLLAACAAAGAERLWLLRRTLRAVLAFNLTVSLGYLLVAGLRHGPSADYLLLVNLRVLLLVYLGFWLVARVNLALALALAPFPTLSFLVTLAAGQALTLRRLALDFRLAFTSRSPAPPGLPDRARSAGAQGLLLLDKALAASTEITQAMRSRGCFEEPDEANPTPDRRSI